jgi:hypothetical protein
MIIMPKGEKNNTPLDLWDFSKIVTYGHWDPVPHLNVIIEFIHYALAGQLENFMCALSPRLGKSMLMSEIFPAYYLGMRPYAKVILVSYSDELSRRFGEKARNTFKEFGYLFDPHIKLSPDTQSKSRWTINGNTGEFYCSSTRGGVLGRGGNLIVIDDPTKNMEEARSSRHQEELRSLFDTAITTRKEKDPVTGQNAIVFVLHQRLDENDLIGIISEKEEWITAEEALPRLRNGEKLGSTWVYLRLPELAEEEDMLGRLPGEALWPDKRDEKKLAEIAKNIGERQFNAIHQQDPKPKQGQYFNEDYFEVIEIKPTNVVEEIQWWDLAATSYPDDMPLSQRGAATASVRLALTADRKLVVTDLQEFWKESEDVQTEIINNAKIAGKGIKQRIPQDPGQASKGQIKTYSIHLPGHNFNGIIESGSKEDRAEPVGNWAKINKIYILNKDVLAADDQTPIIKRFIKQCANFPTGKQKDFVDALSGAYSELEIPEEEEDVTPFVGTVPLW